MCDTGSGRGCSLVDADAGFALIDAIVALAVLMIVFLPAAMLMMNAATTTGTFRAKMVGESIASGILAQERSAAANPSCLYTQSVLDASPTDYWPMNEAPGSTSVSDTAGSDTAYPYPNPASVGYGATPGPVSCDTSESAMSFSPAAGGFLDTAGSLSGPQTFTIAAWFKTGSDGGIIQFGDQQTAEPGNYDRHLYVGTDGKLHFGVCGSQCTMVLSSPGTVDDGLWHFAVGTLSPSGMRLYLDGLLVASNSAWTNAQSIDRGWWRIGELGNGGGWPDTPGGGPFPFNGQLAQVAVWDSAALTGSQVQALYQAASGTYSFPPQAPVALPKLWYSTPTTVPFVSDGTWCPEYSASNPTVPCTPVVQKASGITFASYVTGGWCVLSSSGQWGNGTVPASGGIGYFVAVKTAWGGGSFQASPFSVASLSTGQSVVESTQLPIPPNLPVGSAEPAPGWSVASCPVGLS